MSMRTDIYTICDKCGKECGQYSSSPKASSRESRKMAKGAGWKLGKSKDFCPSCAEQIKEAVKQAASGNLS